MSIGVSWACRARVVAGTAEGLASAVVDLPVMSALTTTVREILARNSSSRALLPAGLLCLLEAVAAVGFALVTLPQIHPARWVVGVGTVITMLAYGVVLGLAAFGLWRHRGWARGVAVCAQLLHLPIAWSFLQGSDPVALTTGIVLGVVSLAVLVGIFWPTSIRVFADPNGPAGQH